MISKKLAGLLATAAMLGQASLSTVLFAKADTQVPQLSLVTPQAQSLQVASVIPHTGIEALPGGSQAGESQEGIPHPSTPDIYTIGGGAGKLPTIIQVLPQDGNTTSLFVNGTEILRFQGTVSTMDAYTRVKIVADRLNRMLTTDGDALNTLQPKWQSSEDGQKQAVVALDGDVLATVDVMTAKAAQESQPKLAVLYTNRLRQVLGQAPLQSQNVTAFLQGASTVAHDEYQGTGRRMVGMASWYGGYFHGRRAADGSRFNMNALTAAHKTLPFGTVVRVINQRNQKSCYVRITDRGPYAHGRIIDLSRGAATAIGMLGSGVARVSLEVVKHSS